MYIFIVDTDQYAGNFERQMVAYMTGIVGECGVGEEHANDIKETLDDIVISVPDEHGCCRPATILSTPGYFNNGVGGHYEDGQEDIALEERNKNYIQYNRERGANLDVNKPLEKYPACQSVGCYLSRKFNDDTITLLKERAQKFVELPEHKNIKILGFRLLERKTVELDVQI